MSSEYIPRLRRELVAAAAREPVRRRPAVRPLALAFAVAATVLVLVTVLRPEAAPEPAGDTVEYTLPSADAAVLRERVAGAGLRGVDVTVDGDVVRVSGPPELRPALAAVTAPGHFGIYQWERSVVGDSESPLPLFDAVLRAAERPGAGAGGAYWLLDDAHHKVLAGPSRSGGFATPGHVVRVPAGTLVARAEGAPNSGYVLSGAPAITNADVTGVRTGRDPQVDEPVVLLDFTARGAAAFTDLTRAVARQGSAAHADQHIALVLDDQVLSVPYISYKQAPDGIDGTAGAQISGGDSRMIAAILASGPLPSG